MIRPPMNEAVSAETAEGDAWVNRDAVWLTQRQMANLFEWDQSVLNCHICNVFAERELDPESTCAKFAHVQSEGGWPVTKEADQYNLDVVAHRDLQEGATAEHHSVVQIEGRRPCRWVTHRLRERRLDESSPYEGRFLMLPSTQAAPFTESAPSTKGIMARPIVNLLVEPNA